DKCDSSDYGKTLNDKSAWRAHCRSAVSATLEKRPEPPFFAGRYFLFQNIHRRWLFRQRFSRKDGARILHAKAFGFRLAVAAQEKVVGFAHDRRARGRIVCIGGDDMYPAQIEKLPRHALGAFAEISQQGTGGHLDQASHADPFG